MLAWRSVREYLIGHTSLFYVEIDAPRPNIHYSVHHYQSTNKSGHNERDWQTTVLYMEVTKRLAEYEPNSLAIIYCSRIKDIQDRAESLRVTAERPAVPGETGGTAKRQAMEKPGSLRR